MKFMEDAIEYEVTHSEEYLLHNTKFNIDFIPTFDEYKLLVEKGYTENGTLSLGVPPLFILKVPEGSDRDMIAKIEALTRNERIDGLDEMFVRLLESYTTDSYEDYKIYYLAYLLAAEGIEVHIEGQEYRDKLKIKKQVIHSYKKRLKRENAFNV